MSSFCFVHAADLDLDVPFRGVGKLPAALADVLRDASLAAWESLVDLTLAREAAFLLLAGGLYEGHRHGLRGQTRFRQGLERLAEHGVAVCIVCGERDSLEPWAARPEWPSGVTVFGPDDVQTVVLQPGGERLATVHGVSSAPGGRRASPVEGFRSDPNGGLQVGLLVGDAGIDELRSVGLNYWALGGGRQHRYLSEADPWAVYPGTLQARSLTPHDFGPKGPVVVEVEEGAVRRVQFEELGRVRIERIEVAETEQQGQAELARFLLERAAQLRDPSGARLLLLQASFSSCGPARRQLGRPAAAEAFLADLRRLTDEGKGSPWWLGLHDAFDAPEPRPARGAARALTEELLRRSERLSKDPEARSAFLEQRLEPLMHTWAAALDPDDADGLQTEATSLAVRLLDSDDFS